MGPRAVLGATENTRPYRNSKTSETFLNPVRIKRAIKHVHSSSCKVIDIVV